MGAKLYQSPMSLEEYFRRDPEAFRVMVDASEELEELFKVKGVKRARTKWNLGNWGFSRLVLLIDLDPEDSWERELVEDLTERFYKMGYHALLIHHKIHLERIYTERL